MKSKNLSKKEKALALQLLKIGAIKFGSFKLKLHEEHPKAPLSPIYIDLRVLRRFPIAKKVALNVYQELLRNLKFDLLADVPTAGTPLTSSLSDRVGKGMITPRTDKKTHGSGAKIDGMVKEDKGKKVVLIDDLITTSASKLEAIEILRDSGVKVSDVVVLVDREQGGGEQLKKKEIKLHYALTLNKLLDYYLDEKKLTKKQYDEIRQRVLEINKYLGLG